MTKDEALKLALKALEQYAEYEGETIAANEAITAIKEALAQPEQESDDLTAAYMTGVYDGKKQRTWVGLTDEEIQYCVELKNPEAIAEEVEAKLKEKNT